MLFSATRLLRHLLTAAVATAALPISSAHAQAPAWDLAAIGSPTQVYGTSQIRAVAADASGNVYVTGSFIGSVAFGSTTLAAVPGSSDLFVAKWVAGTGTWAWAQRGGGTGNDAGYGIAVSGTSVYVTGSLVNNGANGSAVRFGGATPASSATPVSGATSATSQDLFVAKYTDNGNSATFGWAQVGGGTSNYDQGTGVAVSGSSVYVSGFFYNNTANANGVLFGGGGTTAGTTSVNGASATIGEDLLLVKYTDNGSTATLGWTQVGGGSSDDFGQGVAASGNSVYVTGSLYNTAANANAVLFGGSGTTAGTTQVSGAGASASADLVLVKYTDNGSTAALAWTQVGGGTSFDGGQAVAVSGSSVYVAGTLGNTTANGGNVLFGGSGTTAGTVPVSGSSTNLFGDLLLAKYTDNGSTATFTWAQVGGGTGNDSGTGVAVNGPSVYLTGSFNNSSTNASGATFGGSSGTPGVAVPGVAAAANFDWVLAKYQDNGSTATLGWAQASGSLGEDQAANVAVGGGSVYTGGYVLPSTSLLPQLIFGPTAGQAVQGTASTRALLARATDTGLTGAWTGVAAATNGGTSVARATATDASGNVLVTGSFTGEVDFGSTRLSSAGGNDLFVAKYVPATNTWAWAQRGGGVGDDGGYGVAASNGSVYVAGSYTNTLANGQSVTFGGPNPSSSAVQVNGCSTTSSADLVLAKYQDSGSTATLGWTQTGGGTRPDRAYGVAASGTSVYVTGVYNNTRANDFLVVFGGSGTTAGTVQVNGVSTSYTDDLFLNKYQDNGSTATLAWNQTGGGDATDRGMAVAVSGSSVYVTGNIFNTATNTLGVLFGGGGTTLGTVPVNGAGPGGTLASPDLLLAKYTDQGALVWTQVGGGSREDQGNGVAVSGSSVYVTGQIRNDRANTNAVLFGGGGTTAGTVTQAGASTTASVDLVLAKWTDNGPTATFNWSQVGGGTSNDVGYAVAATPTSVYVTGSITTTATNANGVVFGGSGTAAGLVAVPGVTSFANIDLVLARYLDNGASASLGWTRVGGSDYDDIGYGVAVSGQSVYVGTSTPMQATYAPLALNLLAYGGSALLARVTDTGTLPVRAVTAGTAGLALYPNPATGAATLTGAPAGSTVQVLDALGRLVVATQADIAGTARLVLPAGLALGVYVVRAGTGATRLVVE